jgi:hypothetical protein
MRNLGVMIAMLGVVGCGQALKPDAGTDAGLPAETCSSVDDPAPGFVERWSFQGVDSGIAWTSDAGTSGCSARGYYLSSRDFGYHCAGRATVSLDGGPVLRLDDGSTLTWLPRTAGDLQAPPLAEGESVEVDTVANFSISTLVPSFINNLSFSLRRSSTGQLLWFSATPRPQDFDATAVFGVTATPQLACVIPTSTTPGAAVRSKFDHVLATTPGTVIPDGTQVRVVTPTGSWDVLWVQNSDAFAGESPGRFSEAFAARYAGP